MREKKHGANACAAVNRGSSWRTLPCCLCVCLCVSPRCTCSTRVRPHLCMRHQRRTCTFLSPFFSPHRVGTPAVWASGATCVALVRKVLAAAELCVSLHLFFPLLSLLSLNLHTHDAETLPIRPTWRASRMPSCWRLRSSGGHPSPTSRSTLSTQCAHFSPPLQTRRCHGR